MRVFALVSLLGLVAGCTTAPDTDEVCDRMCTELVMTCEFAAYPSFDSCMAGCAYSREEGADVDHESVCITQAGCDEAAIIECEHSWGPGGTKLGSAQTQD